MKTVKQRSRTSNTGVLDLQYVMKIVYFQHQSNFFTNQNFLLYSSGSCGRQHQPEEANYRV